ncbi:MAG: ribonuclease Z [Bacteroidales bacterium]|nr:ribonuclease Z [Bacteroidales bacterium]
MSPFTVTILGSNSAMPTLERNMTAQVINIHDNHLLFDCADGTQLQMRKLKVKMQRINHIFISHMHGDHYFGLIGLIFTYHLLGRQNELHVYGPPILKKIIDIQLEASETKLLYPLSFHPIDSGKSELLLDHRSYTVRSFPVTHSIPTVGFTVTEKQADRKLRKEVLEKENIPVEVRQMIKQGADYTTPEGKFLENESMTEDPPKPRSYAYSSDTRYDESIIDYIKDSNLLYHEATFTEDMKDKALDRFHSTARQAALIAGKAGAGKLVLGHFSARYDELEGLQQEAREVFPNTYLAEDGSVFEVA